MLRKRRFWCVADGESLSWYTHDGYKLPAMFKTRLQARMYILFYRSAFKHAPVIHHYQLVKVEDSKCSKP